MLKLDASHGEGGGQVLRTALALSVALRRPVALSGIRARRPKPGLQPQHLTAVRALATISDAQVSGDALDSTELTFAPRAVRGGDYRFDVGAIRGSAGSVSLLVQALLLPLALAREPSHLRLVGGTHAPWSPPVHYLSGVLLPALEHVGLDAEVTLHRWGWYPRGGGEVEVRIEPGDPGVSWRGLRWETPPSRPGVLGISAVSRLPREIAERQRRQALTRLHSRGLVADIALVEDTQALDRGTFLFLSVSAAGAHAGFSALGRRGVTAEAVADEAVDALVAYLDSSAAVDDHLADQLVPYLALAGGPSVFTCPSPSHHLRTVVWTVQQFVGARIEIADGHPTRIAIAPEIPPAPG
ncbi:MAG TPA: RNA 3'-terminal phosphate cyclase [Methylomirabilota bacterium]|nr:RNA 3'-terminal phosphate cyclase [Methylomirabilota bacterium]